VINLHLPPILHRF